MRTNRHAGMLEASIGHWSESKLHELVPPDVKDWFPDGEVLIIVPPWAWTTFGHTSLQSSGKSPTKLRIGARAKPSQSSSSSRRTETRMVRTSGDSSETRLDPAYFSTTPFQSGQAKLQPRQVHNCAATRNSQASGRQHRLKSMIRAMENNNGLRLFGNNLSSFQKG